MAALVLYCSANPFSLGEEMMQAGTQLCCFSLFLGWVREKVGNILVHNVSASLLHACFALEGDVLWHGPSKPLSVEACFAHHPALSHQRRAYGFELLFVISG